MSWKELKARIYVTRENYKAILTGELIALFMLGAVIGMFTLAFSLVAMWYYGRLWAYATALVWMVFLAWFSTKRLPEFTDWWVGKLKELFEEGRQND
jgi:Flp pilus assembly protein TadB